MSEWHNPPHRCLIVRLGSSLRDFYQALEDFDNTAETLPNAPADAKWLSVEERNWLTSTLAADRAEVEKVGVASLWRTSWCAPC
jgi:hypothetical protein